MFKLTTYASWAWIKLISSHKIHQLISALGTMFKTQISVQKQPFFLTLFCI